MHSINGVSYIRTQKCMSQIMRHNEKLSYCRRTMRACYVSWNFSTAALQLYELPFKTTCTSKWPSTSFKVTSIGANWYATWFPISLPLIATMSWPWTIFQTLTLIFLNVRNLSCFYQSALHCLSEVTVHSLLHGFLVTHLPTHSWCDISRNGDEMTPSLEEEEICKCGPT